MSAGFDEIRQTLIDPSQFSADWIVRNTDVVVQVSAITKLIDPNPRRISLLFGFNQSGGSATFNLSTDSKPAAGHGVFFTGTVQLLLSYAMHGGLVQSGFWAFNPSFGAGSISIIETIWLPSGG